MKPNITLEEAYHKAPYQLAGHGPRNMRVLQEAFALTDGDAESDMYGKGDLIEGFESRMAEVLGKEAAVFFPSGTMAQQIALRIWCDEADNKTVAYHPLCHLEIHEEDGLKELHGITPLLLADKDRLITLTDVREVGGDISCLLLELPQREIGGQLPPFGELEAIASYCRETGIRLHLDGARLFEILPYYGKTAAEVCALFDSVYISFYKGIGGIAGAVLAGPSAFTEQSKVWKRRHGGDLIGLYPYIIPADYYFSMRAGRMERYYKGAAGLAERFNGCPGIRTLPRIPVSNMFHVHMELPKERAEAIAMEVARETGVRLVTHLRSSGEASCYYELSVGDRLDEVPAEKLEQAFQWLHSLMAAAVKE